MLLRLAMTAAGVVLLTVPFGYWRAGTRKLSARWFVAVHGAVPLVVALRLLAGVRWHPGTFVVLAASYFSGQFIGGRVRERVVSRRPASGTRPRTESALESARPREEDSPPDARGS